MSRTRAATCRAGRLKVLYDQLAATTRSATPAHHRHHLRPVFDYCALATARSIPIAEIISSAADAFRQEDIGALKIKFPVDNACGHHHAGHIGILGLGRKGEEITRSRSAAPVTSAPDRQIIGAFRPPRSSMLSRLSSTPTSPSGAAEPFSKLPPRRSGAFQGGAHGTAFARRSTSGTRPSRTRA